MAERKILVEAVLKLQNDDSCDGCQFHTYKEWCPIWRKTTKYEKAGDGFMRPRRLGKCIAAERAAGGRG